MAKYIDADKLKEEIERKIAQYSDWAEEEWEDDREYNHGAFGALKNVRLIIDSLRQEQESVAEKFARIVRGNLIGIDKEVQHKFEQLYFEITGNKMYGGYND